AMYQPAVSGFTCAWLEYFELSSGSRSAGTWSAPESASAWPFSICVTSASTVRPNFSMIVSGLPFGWASFDHSLKNGFRTIFICCRDEYWTNLYGPVPGGGMLTSFIGVEAGSANANGTPS